MVFVNRLTNIAKDVKIEVVLRNSTKEKGEKNVSFIYGYRY